VELVFVMGIFPGPFLDRMQPSVERLVQDVQKRAEWLQQGGRSPVGEPLGRLEARSKTEAFKTVSTETAPPPKSPESLALREKESQSNDRI
jgi:hypothetical protein